MRKLLIRLPGVNYVRARLPNCRRASGFGPVGGCRSEATQGPFKVCHKLPWPGFSAIRATDLDLVSSLKAIPDARSRQGIVAGVCVGNPDPLTESA